MTRVLKFLKAVVSALLVAVILLYFLYGVMQGLLSGNMATKRHPEIRPVMRRRLPNALIIGVRKAGTRALLDFLNLHPRIRTPGPECHFFDREEKYNKGLGWYRQQMSPSLPGDITIEKTPAYFVTDHVAPRIFNMSKTVKLIVIVRDPTERAISDYTQHQTSKDKEHPLPPFEKLVTADQEEKVLKKNSKLVQKGLYVTYLRRWLEYFPLKQIHVVSGEQLVKDPAAVVRAIESFLNLEHLITEEAFYVNETKGFPCAKKDDGKSGCLGAGKGRRHPNIREDIVKMLRNFYQPFNEELFRVVGRHFNWPQN